MKYTLHKELLDQKEILSHVFFSCAMEFIDDIAKENEGKTKEERSLRKIDIELKIHGHVVDPKKFFDRLYDRYESHIRDEASEIVKEQTSKVFRDLSDKITSVEEIVDSWAEDINWDVENPFKK